MAISYSCDGCGKAVENPERVGHIVKREYCAECKEVANAFIDAEEGLRRDIHEVFIDGRAKLIASAPPGFKLPDVLT